MRNNTLRTVALTASLSLATLFAGGTASAAFEKAPDLDHAGTFIISAERIFGFSYDKSSGPNGTSDSTTAISLVGAYGASSVYTIPRLALDYTVTSLITLGGSIGYGDVSYSTSQSNGNGITTTTSPASSDTFVFSPRVGFLYDFGPVDFWGRAGFTYYHTSQGDLSTSGLGFDLEPRLVAELTDHFGFYGGLSLDLPLSGSDTTSDGGISTSVDDKKTHFGIDFGLVGWL